MGLPLFLAAVGTASSFIGQRKAGKAAEQDAQRQAKQMQIEKILGEAQADEQMANRFASYNYAMAESNAMFLGGMESAQEAFRASQRKILLKDVSTISGMKTLQSGQATLASSIEIERGKNARKASFFNALGTVGSAAFQYMAIK
tara:strand:+ start:19263 stop:19697 length:435 start_codon:yes stop_codon:yes gene_type:complete